MHGVNFNLPIITITDTSAKSDERKIENKNANEKTPQFTEDSSASFPATAFENIPSLVHLTSLPRINRRLPRSSDVSEAPLPSATSVPPGETDRTHSGASNHGIPKRIFFRTGPLFSSPNQAPPIDKVSVTSHGEKRKANSELSEARVPKYTFSRQNLFSPSTSQVPPIGGVTASPPSSMHSSNLPGEIQAQPPMVYALTPASSASAALRLPPISFLVGPVLLAQFPQNPPPVLGRLFPPPPCFSSELTLETTLAPSFHNPDSPKNIQQGK